jgi:beta-glucanase (GH16 family)
MRRLLTAIVAASFALILSIGAVAAGGPPALSFYVDGQQYRTIATPTDLSGTGAPAHSFDRIFALGGGLANVSEAKPGDSDYNGGRWMVLPITWHVTPVQLTSAEQVEAYADEGKLTIGSEPVARFVCPVIKVPAGS